MLSTLELLTSLACLALVVILGSLWCLLAVIEYALLVPAFVVAAVRAALEAVCGVLWGRVYP